MPSGAWTATRPPPCPSSDPAHVVVVIVVGGGGEAVGVRSYERLLDEDEADRRPIVRSCRRFAPVAANGSCW